VAALNASYKGRVCLYGGVEKAKFCESFMRVSAHARTHNVVTSRPTVKPVLATGASP
jgi:hypothetical protein